jgi:hypothetical protein
MEAQGLVPGATLQVEKRQAEGGRHNLRVARAKRPPHVVGHEHARRIYVTPDR